jgi:DNA-binding transcriptional LysR family regulator
MNIASVNLNLLVAFEALLEERSVSRAAARIGLSQPAMSNALKRLRAVFGDPLFTRTATGMAATPRARELAGPVRGGLEQLGGALAGRAPFDPAASTRAFRIAASDYAELRVVAPLLRKIQTCAPGVQILVRRSAPLFHPPEEALRDRTLDAAIGFYPEASALEPGTRSAELFSEENVFIARRGHPLMRRRLTLRRFAAAAHAAVITRSDGRGFIDDLLAGHGLRRRLQAATPDFLTAAHLVAGSDLIAVVPAGLAARLRGVMPLTVRKVPLHVPRFRMRLLWFQHGAEDPAREWLCSEIAGCFSEPRPRLAAD